MILTAIRAMQNPVKHVWSWTYTWVDFIWNVKLLACVQHNWRNDWIVSVANAREQVMDNLHETQQSVQ